MDDAMKNIYGVVKRNLDRKEKMKQGLQGVMRNPQGTSIRPSTQEIEMMLKKGKRIVDVETPRRKAENRMLLEMMNRPVGPRGAPVSSYTVSSTGRTTTQGNLTPRQKAEMLATAGKRVAKRAFPVGAGIAAGAGLLAGRRAGEMTRQTIDQLRARILSRILSLAQ